MVIKVICILQKDILSSRYYINDIYRIYANFIKNFDICIQNNKNKLKKPDIIQIIPAHPKDVYQLDLEYVPEKLKSDENATI